MLSGLNSINERKPYERWEKAIPDNVSFRGEELEPLNKRTMELIHEKAIKYDRTRLT